MVYYEVGLLPDKQCLISVFEWVPKHYWVEADTEITSHIMDEIEDDDELQKIFDELMGNEEC